MCIEITIGTVKYTDVDHSQANHDRDVADCWIVHQAELSNPGTFDHAAVSADDFVSAIAAAVGAVREGECRCIKKLVVYGHGTAGLGGKQTFRHLSDSGKELLETLVFGEGATIEVRGCLGWSYAYHPKYIYHPELALLLTENGGTYCSYRSYVYGTYPFEGARSAPGEGLVTPGHGLHCAPIPKKPEMTLEQMKRLFVGEFSLADNTKAEVEAMLQGAMGSVATAAKAEIIELKAEVEQLKALVERIDTMTAKLDAVETKLEATQALNEALLDKVETMQSALDALSGNP